MELSDPAAMRDVVQPSQAPRDDLAPRSDLWAHVSCPAVRPCCRRHGSGGIHAAEVQHRREDMLASINIFRDLPPEALRALSQRCRWSRYRSNQTVVQGQDESRDVFFVARGRVCAIHYSPCGHEVRFSELPQGEMFGEFAAIDGEPRSTDVVTISQALLVSMSAELFWDVLRNHPTVCEAVLRRLTRIVRAISQRVIEFSTLPVRSRIHAELLRLA